MNSNQSWWHTDKLVWLCQIHLKEISNLLLNLKEAEAFQTCGRLPDSTLTFPGLPVIPTCHRYGHASSLLRVKYEGRKHCYLARLRRANSVFNKEERKRQCPKFKKRKQVWDKIMNIRVEISKKKRKKSIKLKKSEVSWLKSSRYL